MDNQMSENVENLVKVDMVDMPAPTDDDSLYWTDRFDECVSMVRAEIEGAQGCLGKPGAMRICAQLSEMLNGALRQKPVPKPIVHEVKNEKVEVVEDLLANLKLSSVDELAGYVADAMEYKYDLQRIQRLCQTDDTEDVVKFIKQSKRTVVARTSTHSNSSDTIVAIDHDNHSSNLVHSLMKGLESMHAPPVKDFSGEDNEYRINIFLTSFVLKYDPQTVCGDRRVMLFRHHLRGHAAATFDALPKTVTSGSFDQLVDEFKVRLVENSGMTKQLACTKFMSLQKKSNQSLLQFFTEVDCVASRAFPRSDPDTMSTLKANVVVSALSDWNEHDQLVRELQMASAADAYARIRETATRIDAVRTTFQKNTTRSNKTFNNSADWYDQKVNSQDYDASGDRSRSSNTGNWRRDQNNQFKQKEPWSERNGQGKNSHSASMAARQDFKDNVEEVHPWLTSSLNVVESTQFENKEFIGKRWTGSISIEMTPLKCLFDSGSNVSVISKNLAKRLLSQKVVKPEQLKEGCSIDVRNASGSKMSFCGRLIANVSFNSRLSTGHFLISNSTAEQLIIGSNILPNIGFHPPFKKILSQCHTMKTNQGAPTLQKQGYRILPKHGPHKSLKNPEWTTWLDHVRTTCRQWNATSEGGGMLYMPNHKLQHWKPASGSTTAL